jgi:ribonuclease HII
MKNFMIEDELEAGLDEAGRGCLSGPVFAAVVILPKEFHDEQHHLIRDSKKLSHQKRLIMRDYIEANAIDYAVAKVDAVEIDKINILKASHTAMHYALDDMKTLPETLLVDGNNFKPYRDLKGELIPHTCVVDGDNTYRSIAAASILAKVYRDEYIVKLCDEEPYLDNYGWRENKGYGTKKHREAIINYGLTKYHRRTFGLCKRYSV